MTDYVKSWFLRADEDLLAIKLLLEENGPANIICFHAQQVGEKYLKGFLAYHDKHARKIHNLPILLDECQKIDPACRELESEVNYLNQFYMETRYPGDIPDFSLNEAKKALEAATKVRDFILEKVK